MNTRPDQRRKHLLEYLHLTVEDVVRSGDARRSDPVGAIVSAVLKRLAAEAFADAQSVVVAYLVDKTAQGVGEMAERSPDPFVRQVLNGVGGMIVDAFTKKQATGGHR